MQATGTMNEDGCWVVEGVDLALDLTAEQENTGVTAEACAKESIDSTDVLPTSCSDAGARKDHRMFWDNECVLESQRHRCPNQVTRGGLERLYKLSLW